MNMTIVMPEKLELEGVVKSFPGKRGARTTVLDGIDLTVSDGELVCIVGASGCGKSTLLNIVGGLDFPTEGRVEVDGEPLAGPGADRGMVFQGYSLFPWKTVAQNVAFGLETTGVAAPERARFPTGRMRSLANCRVGCASVSRSRALLRHARTCCCWTSRSAHLTPRPSARCRTTCCTCGSALEPPS
jgi:ABC-type taurine transport system ATPase subunit